MGLFDIFKQRGSDSGFPFFESGTKKISQNDFEGEIDYLNDIKNGVKLKKYSKVYQIN